LAADRVQNGACVLFLPEDAKLYYGFFQPDLLSERCAASGTYDSAVLARSPFDPDQTHDAAKTQLVTRGLMRQSSTEFHGPVVEFYKKPGY